MTSPPKSRLNKLRAIVSKGRPARRAPAQTELRPTCAGARHCFLHAKPLNSLNILNGIGYCITAFAILPVPLTAWRCGVRECARFKDGKSGTAMTQRTKICDSLSPREKRSSRGRVDAGLSPGKQIYSIGFCSSDWPDPEEPCLRAALENVDDMAWRPFQIGLACEDPGHSGLDLLCLNAVIVVLKTAERSVVEPLFGRLRVGNPNRPLLVAPRSLNAVEISELLALGASDFLLPPYRPEDLLPRLRRLLNPLSRRGALLARIRAGVGLRNIVGESRGLLAEVSKLPRIAACDAPVLIRGESGTGKEIFARAIHYLGARSGQPFVPVNCGAIPEQLVESELFGHRRGAFTGAVRDRTGIIGEADGGTILLDEVDALPLASQVKLLRFLQDGEFRPLGASRPVRAAVRVIAAANSDFETIIKERKFREDLFYRLNVLQISLPPLRDRSGDLPLLAQHLLEKQSLLLGCERKPLSAGAQDSLARYGWPGNVRELENVLTRALVFSEGTEIQSENLELPVLQDGTSDDSFRTLKARAVKEFERDYLQKMLDRHQGNITHAAKAAAKNRRAFWQLLRKHNLSPAR
jgi:two-component system response regulator GlrR